VKKSSSGVGPQGPDSPGCPEARGPKEEFTNSELSAPPSIRLSRYEGVTEHVVGHLPSLRDPLVLVGRPVDAEIGAALTIFLRGLRESCELRGISGRTVPFASFVVPLSSSETKVKGISSVP
jgi:hypothetical protein